MAYKFQRGEAILSGALLQEGDIEIESGFSLKIGNAEMSEADLEQLDGLTAGTVAASKAIVVDANKDFSGLRNATATGAITAGTSFIIGSADLNETDLEKLDGITNGTVAASKAVVVDAQKAAAGFSKLTISGSGDELVIGSGTGRTLGVLLDGGDDFFVMGHDSGAVTLSASSGVEFVGGSEGVGSFGSDIKVYATQAGSTTNVSLGANGVISGSSKLEIGGTVRLDGAADTALDVAADSFYFFDATNSLMKRDSMADYATAIAGDGLGASSGVLAVQVHGNGGIELASDSLQLNIDGMDALGGASIDQADEFAFSDAGTVKKVTFSNLEDSIFGNVSGDIAVAAGGAATIQADAVESGMLNDNVISGQTELAADGLAAADELLISDGGTLKKIGVDNLFLDGPGLLAEAAVTVADDYIMFLDGGATGDAKKESVADLAAAFAGTGLKAASGVLALDANELSQAAVASGDFFVFEDATDNSTKKESVDDLATLFAGTGLAAASAVLSLDLNELSAAAVDVANDSIAIIDANDSNGSKKESIADLVSAMAGAGLTAASGQLKVTGNDVHSKADGDTLQEGYNYFAALDTSGNSAAVTLPGSPSNGDVVHVKAGALTNDAVIVISRAGSQTIDGETSITLESTYAAVSLVYVGSDAWRIV